MGFLPACPILVLGDRSEVRSRDLGLKTTYFQGEVRWGGYMSCPSKLSGKAFDKSDQNKP